jgi:fructose-1,6-bisphosphatase II
VPTPQAPDRNLALELVRATEAAAMASARWMGRDDKEGGDQAAVDAMRLLLGSVDMDGVVVIGEGEKDHAPMLYNGERVGTGAPPEVDIAVDPVEGTTLLAEGRPGSIAVIAVAPRGAMFDPGPVMYMLKWVVSAEAAGLIDLDAPVARNLEAIGRAKGKPVQNLTGIVLDRPRHRELIADIRAAGARLRLIDHGDVAGALLAAMPDEPYDMLIGIGGTPEGVLTAAALKAVGGEMIGRLWARDEAEAQAARDAGYDLDEQLTTDRLCASNDTYVAATGITPGDLLDGVTYHPDGAVTDSLAFRGRSGTVRRIRARHRLDKLREYTGGEYG